MSDPRIVIDRILELRRSVQDCAALVAVSGIDGAGKGWLAARISAGLQDAGMNAANLNIDGWLNLPDKRFSRTDPAEHFYLHAIRFDEMFSQLVLQLRDRLSTLKSTMPKKPRRNTGSMYTITKIPTLSSLKESIY